MCSDCKRNKCNDGNCSGKPNTCFLFVDVNLPDENPVVSGNIKRADKGFDVHINS